MTVATAIDPLEGVAQSAAPPLTTDDPRLVETLELFVPYAKGRVADVRHNALELAADAVDRDGRVPTVRRGLRRLAAQFEVLKCVGAARLCRATEAAIAASDNFPGTFVIDAAAALDSYLDELALDLSAEIHDVRGLLAALRGDGDVPVTMTVAGEFASDQDEFLGAAREQLAQLRQNLRDYADCPDLLPLATARSAARGIAGIGGLLDLAPLVEVAAAVSGELLRAAPEAVTDDAGVDHLLGGVDVLQQLLDGLDGDPMPSIEQVAVALDRCSSPPAAESLPPAAMQFLVVVVDGQLYGLDTARLGAVVGLSDLDAGIATVDLGAQLGLPAIAPSDVTAAVILENRDDQAIRQALLVDEVQAVIACTPDQCDDFAAGGLVRGRAKLPEGVVQLLDLDVLQAATATATEAATATETEAATETATATEAATETETATATETGTETETETGTETGTETEAATATETATAEPAPAAKTLPQRVQIVIVDSMLYGLDAERVDEIVGAVNIGAAGMPTIDLRAERVGVPAAATLSPGMVVVRSGGPDAPARTGLLVDQVGEILELAEGQLEPQHGGCFAGSAQLDQGVLRVLDLERVLAATAAVPPAAQ